MLTTIVSTVALTASLLGGAVSTVPADAPTITCTLGSVWSRLPADLRTDLKALRDLEPGSERIAAAQEIKTEALAGDYGPAVQKRVEAIQEHGAGAAAKLWLLNNCR